VQSGRSGIGGLASGRAPQRRTPSRHAGSGESFRFASWAEGKSLNLSRASREDRERLGYGYS
jgi:hypothetical protein